MDNNQYNYYEESNVVEENPSVKPKKEKKKHKGFKKVVAIVGAAALFGVVSGGVFVATAYYGTNTFLKEKVHTADAVPYVNNISHTGGSDSSNVSVIVKEVMPSVVSITNMSIQQVQDFFFGGVFEQKSESAGTGIIISQTDDEILIVTNNHVVAGSEELTVTFADNESVTADIKGTDPAHDIAVIAVQLDSMKDETKDEIAVAVLGNSDDLKVGEPAIAIGNALGYGQSVTVGVISAMDRTLSQAGGSDQPGAEDVKLIQTDAAINHGNSGGALVNSRGEVIGINSSKLVGNSVEGVGYAIPISDVSDIIMELMNQKTKIKVAEEDRGFLGITGFDVVSDYADSFDMPIGVYVKEVTKDGAAKKAGIEKGDIIVKLDGATINSMSTLKEQLRYYAAGDEVKVTVQKPADQNEYEEEEYEVILEKAPEEEK